MLEKIGQKGFETISKPDEIALSYLDDVLSTVTSPNVAEIGVGVGATSVEIAKKLANNGTFFLFSRQDHVVELADDLSELGYKNINSDWGSPNKLFSGYHFELARAVSSGAINSLDYVYLDGGHLFHLDAPTVCLIKEILAPGGYLVMDDWNWSLEKSPTLNPEAKPETSKLYDQNQIETSHVKMVANLFLDNDPNYVFLELTGNTAVYQRLPAAQANGVT